MSPSNNSADGFLNALGDLQNTVASVYPDTADVKRKNIQVMINTLTQEYNDNKNHEKFNAMKNSLNDATMLMININELKNTCSNNDYEKIATTNKSNTALVAKIKTSIEEFHDKIISLHKSGKEWAATLLQDPKKHNEDINLLTKTIGDAKKLADPILSRTTSEPMSPNEVGHFISQNNALVNDITNLKRNINSEKKHMFLGGTLIVVGVAMVGVGAPLLPVGVGAVIAAAGSTLTGIGTTFLLSGYKNYNKRTEDLKSKQALLGMEASNAMMEKLDSAIKNTQTVLENAVKELPINQASSPTTKEPTLEETHTASRPRH